MGGRILDPKLMAKLAKKLGKKKLTDVNKLVSRTGGKLGISSEAALVILAKQQGIGTSSFQKKLSTAKQAEVRDALPSVVASRVAKSVVQPIRSIKSNLPSQKPSLKITIEMMIQDEKLRGRCQPTLLGKSNFDIAINQATLVLEDRIRKKSGAAGKMSGDGLVGFSFNQDISKTLLRVASNDPDDQRGFTDILRGIVAAYRNKTHHHLIDNYSREEALRVCGFIDTLVRVVDTSIKIR